MQHVPPSGQVIYASDPAEDPFARSEAKAVKQPPPYYWIAFRRELPPAPIRTGGEHFLDSGFDPLATAPVFLHRRSTSASERLVVVLFGQQLLGGKSHRVLCHRVVRLATFTRSPVTLSEGRTILASSFEWTASVRVFAGRADPSDPSRFTIEVEVDGKAKTIDGRLNEDDSVELQLRDRPIRPDA